MSAHAGEERLGPYRLREQLGEGGMGVVYLASDPSGRPVAIKALRHAVAVDETARRRLAHEVSIMRRVSSPNVAEIIDADVTGDLPYIVTRYVPGRTLEDVVAADGPMTGAALASLASGLAAALQAVHGAGIVHRDLKPGNVMMVGGQPVVIDFGIAQAADSTRLTMTGMFMGTPGYLAPEVIEGRPSGPAADIHSWGATMAYAATGRPPFGTGSFEAIFYRIVNGQPDLSGMPAPLVPLVLAALARDPARRPHAAGLAESVAGLDPAALVPPVRPLRAAPLDSPGQAPVRTAADASLAAAGQAAAGAANGLALPAAAAASGLPAAGAALPATAGSAVPAVNGAAAATAWPGTRPMAIRGRDDFADLLTPVAYGSAASPAGLARPGPYPAGPAAGLMPPAGPAGMAGGALAAPAARVPARTPLVLLTVAGLVALSVLLPVAGAALALLVLMALRSADVTGRWIGRRRSLQGPRDSDAAAAAAFYPWAVIRSAVRFVLLAPLALLCAGGAAAVAVLLSGLSALPKAGGWAAGALVACYCLGPGSAACRRPLSRFYGRVTRSGFGYMAGLAGLAAIAAVAVTAAAALAPGYWPAAHLGQHLQTASLGNPFLNRLPASLARAGRQLITWVGHRL